MTPEQRRAAREPNTDDLQVRIRLSAALGALDEADGISRILRHELEQTRKEWALSIAALKNAQARIAELEQRFVTASKEFCDRIEADSKCIAELEADLSQAVRVGLDWMDTAKELEADKARLDFIINQSNDGHCWLDESVWDDLPGDSEDVLLEVRAAIDAAMPKKDKQ